MADVDNRAEISMVVIWRRLGDSACNKFSLMGTEGKNTQKNDFEQINTLNNPRPQGWKVEAGTHADWLQNLNC